MLHSDDSTGAGGLRVIAVRRQRALLAAGEPFGVWYLNAASIDAPERLVPLEERAPGSYYLLEVDAATSDEEAFGALGIGAGDARFADVMTQLGRFGGSERARILRAVALAQWSYENRFCGACGFALLWDAGERTKSCTNPANSHRHFPRTDPATIMLVHDGTRALLGRQQSWPPGMYSTLAGFVEPGETAEDGVAREVFEETGVRVTDITYVASESWPFPRSLMLGFTARALTHEIAIGEEMDDVRWFTRDEVATMQTVVRQRLPHFDTIARRLLAGWLETTV